MKLVRVNQRIIETNLISSMLNLTDFYEKVRLKYKMDYGIFQSNIMFHDTGIYDEIYLCV